MKVFAIIVAAGSGRRLGNGVDKMTVRLGGKPLLLHTIYAFESSESIDGIVVVTRRELIDYVSREITGKGGFRKVSSVVEGGAERQDSVICGIKAVGDQAEVILVHDGARPFVTPGLIDAVAEAAEKHGGAIAALRCADTLKSAGNGKVTGTISREALWLAQTPQGFRRELLVKAAEAAETDGFTGTDEASLVERIGGDVVIVEGEIANVKVTTPSDLEFAERLLRGN